MTSLVEARERFDATSAVGAMLMSQVPQRILIGIMIVGLGTSTEVALPIDLMPRPPRIAQTTAGFSVPLGERPGTSIAELRRLSGLTWDQLARLFRVSRRSLHFWASGKAMMPTNEEHLQRLVAALRKLDCGSGSTNRAMLLTPRDDGTIPFDLLAEGRYEQVVSVIGHGQSVPRMMQSQLSDEAKAARAPLPPEELVGALQDRIHRDKRVARAAKSVKIRSGG
jgi:transcriptional regulator with XRE-family HTH domain